MAHKAKDGTEYTNRMMVNKHNARMDSKSTDTTQSSSEPTDQTPQDASENPDADQHVDALLASGMTPDDIHAHAKKRSGQQVEQQEPAPSGSSALSSIPGM